MMRNFLFILFLFKIPSVFGAHEVPKNTSLNNSSDSSISKEDQKLETPLLKIYTQINLIGFGWSDLGVSGANSFIQPIVHSLEKWVIEKLEVKNFQINFCSADCDDYHQWTQISPDENLKKSHNYPKVKWLKIDLYLRRTHFSEKIHESKFEWDGYTFLMDEVSKTLLQSHRILPEAKTWREHNQKNLNSLIASELYKAIGLSIKNAITNLNSSDIRIQPRKMTKLTIQGHKQMLDVVNFMNLLKKEGVETNLDSFDSKRVEVYCTFAGEEKLFKDVLSRLKELKSSHKYLIINEPDGENYLLKFIVQ